MLAWTIYISFLGVVVLMFLPKGNASAARKVAMPTAVVGLLVALAGVHSIQGGRDCHGCQNYHGFRRWASSITSRRMGSV